MNLAKSYQQVSDPNASISNRLFAHLCSCFITASNAIIWPMTVVYGGNEDDEALIRIERLLEVEEEQEEIEGREGGEGGELGDRDDLGVPEKEEETKTTRKERKVLSTQDQPRHQDNQQEEEPMNDDDDVDEVAFHTTPHYHHRAQALVEYQILQSPTYRVPVLYFRIRNLPANGPQGLDAVYHYLVANNSQGELKSVGVLGAISMVNHPITQIPWYFIHPCQTAQAMTDIVPGELSIEYLLAWIGLVGSVVGLYLPKELIMRMEEQISLA